MNLDELLKDIPQHPYYPNNECSEELGLIEYEDGDVRRLRSESTTKTTLWLVALGLLLWTITFLMVMTITMCFDFSFRSATSFTGCIQLPNGTSVLTSDDQTTRYRISY